MIANIIAAVVLSLGCSAIGKLRGKGESRAARDFEKHLAKLKEKKGKL